MICFARYAVIYYSVLSFFIMYTACISVYFNAIENMWKHKCKVNIS